MRAQLLNQELVTSFKVFPVQMEDGPDMYCVASVNEYGEYQNQVSPDYATHAEAATACGNYSEGKF